MGKDRRIMKSIKKSRTRKWKGRILDLHKIRHADVAMEVFNFLYENIDKERMPVEIITGKSTPMAKQVREIVEHMGYLSIRATDHLAAGKVVIDLEDRTSAI